ncbi:pectinesterase [Amborella trichopoda]|uniref:Pectinesterase n=1 Tax=Amborella trichopoda TaxID=13333 RepID=W1PZU9_AMBTC|nr:pectinesterase [Amborella trichopoda]ERN13140.1 hypothetical protein AMTR_s00040p00188020 [Amborella trichopoda]|eukprot:XP_020527274.1 pectinesterase [Amborella trichopoda]
MSSFQGYGHLSQRAPPRSHKRRNLCVAGVSIIVVAAIVIGILATVTRSHNGSSYDASSSGLGSGDGLSTTMRAITTICGPTDHKQACIDSLSQIVGNNASATALEPKELIAASVKATIKQVTGALKLSDSMKATATNGTDGRRLEGAIADCKQLLSFAIDELQDSFSDISGNDMKSLPDRAYQLRVWLSAVLTYHETCVDGLDHPELKATMRDGLANATVMTSNALAIITEISKILSSFQIPFSIPSRRLLETGFPEWLNEGDRRLLAGGGGVRPNAVVAKDGSGQYKKISDAVAAIPENFQGRWIIYVKAGIYEEKVTIPKDANNVFMYGDGARKTIVSGRLNYVDGTSTFQTATFTALGDGFLCKSMAFSNTAGPEKHQAVAVLVKSDMAAFFNCRFDGYQDTLYAHSHRQLYRNCVVSGTIDFIFGDSAAVLQNCKIIVRRPMDNQQNIVTASGRLDKRSTGGIIIHNCRIVPDKRLYPERLKFRTYLGRPWKEYARTIVMESTLGDLIQPDGWMPWEGDFALKTLFYAEYGNKGPGAQTARRVKWSRVIKRSDALQFTAGPFLQARQWLPSTGVPYVLGLVH